jgi:hypothetical protein
MIYPSASERLKTLEMEGFLLKKAVLFSASMYLVAYKLVMNLWNSSRNSSRKGPGS